MTVSLPWLARMTSLPSPASIVRLIGPALRAEASIESLPPRPWMTRVSLAASAPSIVTCADSPLTTTDAPTAPLVALTVTVSGRAVARAVAAGQVDGDLLHVGAGEVVDRDIVGAAQSMELDTLDAVEVHGDGGDVAGEQRMAAIGRDADGFADVGTAEVECIEPALAIDDVAAVARIPDEHVIAVAEECHVV